MNEKISDREEQVSYIKFMQLNRRNRSLLNEIRSNISMLTPFVGAGLSIHFGYPSWIEMFSGLCETELDPTSSEYEEIKEALKKIKDGEKLNKEWETFYSHMADVTVRALCKDGFLSYIGRLFRDRNDITEEKIRESAAYSVASTFRGLCLTTNLDRVMDQAYGLTGRTDVFSPGQEDQIKQLNYSNSSGNEFVFHLHGSVNDVFSNPERIILTTESYKNYYRNSNWFIESLTSIMLFYLGVNLDNEEPFIHLFNKEMPKNRYHYAIYYASSPEEAQLIYNKLLEKYKIKAVIYPTGEYQYVKLIIDWLRKDPPSENDIKDWLQHTYDKYDWPNLSYIDEQNNMEKLSSFLDDSTKFSFIEISGGKWSGKTRLAKEIEKRAKDKNWDVLFFDSESSGMLRLRPNSDLLNTLYILDEATSYSLGEDRNKFGNFLMQLADSKKKVRVIFIYTSLVVPDRWWNLSIETGFNIKPDNYCRDKINLSFSESIAEKMIASFAKAHSNVRVNENLKKIIDYCINAWKNLISADNTEVSSAIKMAMNSPLGCVIMSSILLSRKGEENQRIMEAIKKMLLSIELPTDEINNFLIWVEKYRDQYSILEIIQGIVSLDYNPSEPITSEIGKDIKNIDEVVSKPLEEKKVI